MSKRDVDDYFNQIVEQYHEMFESIKELEDECANGLVDPDHLENMKQLIQPLKQNYLRISYIMFLLDKPKRKKKHKQYEQFNKKLLEKIGSENTLEGIKKENEEVLNSLKLN